MTEKISLKVLTVDDNNTNLQLLQVFLKKLGHEVIQAENGVEAVAKYLEFSPDLIFMDIMMPVMDGFEATREIRALPSDSWVPIIFLSALDRDENLVDGLTSGGDDYLSKPINFVVFEAKMRSMVRTLLLQQKVTESLRQLKTISDNVLEAIITIDSSATILSCNRSVEDMFGWTPEELEGLNVSVLCPEPIRSNHDGYVSNYVNGGPPRIIGECREVPAIRRNGEVFPAELTVSEVRIEKKRMFIGVIRDITERKCSEELLQANAEKLQQYFEASEDENRFALDLISQQLKRKELNNPLVQYWLAPAKTFSGDILAACHSSTGKLYALLADATGHGLTAAISTLPVLTLFYRMAPAGILLPEMVLELNHQLRESMPVGRFVGMTLVCLDIARREGEIWIGGMPAAFLLDEHGEVIERFASQEIPLGIVENKDLSANPLRFNWSQPTQLMLCSDGLLEAASVSGEQFGEKRLLQAMKGISVSSRRDTVQACLQSHSENESSKDDVSLLLISCPCTEH